MTLTGGYTHIKTKGEKVISSSSSLKNVSSTELKKGGKKQKTLKGRKGRKGPKGRKQRKTRRKH